MSRQEETNHFDRLDVSEFNRRLEAMAIRFGQLDTRIAVMAEREEKMADAMTRMQKSVDSLEETLARGRGAVYILSVCAGVMVAVLGFWDKVPKPWNHS